jgi:serine/threonine protein kinase
MLGGDTRTPTFHAVLTWCVCRVLFLRTGPDADRSTFKIGDFGLAVTMEEREWEDGDGKYVAPELLCDDTEATPAADIYSLGATLYEAMCGRQLERQAAMEGLVPFPAQVRVDPPRPWCRSGAESELDPADPSGLCVGFFGRVARGFHHRCSDYNCASPKHSRSALLLGASWVWCAWSPVRWSC